MIASALILGIADGLAQGLVTNYQTKKLANAYKNAAKQVRGAAQKYSGQAADTAMSQEGALQGQQMQKLAQSQGATGTTGLSTSDATAATNNNSGLSAYMQGQNLGRSNKATELNSKYNAATVDAQNMLNKAKTDFNVGQATSNMVFKTLGCLGQAGGNIGMNGATQALGNGAASMFSDENCKEPTSGEYNKTDLNNNSELPNATLGDAMDKLETVIYKYKDETGLDQDCHCGTVAQSLAKEPEFADIVEANEQGVLQLNKDKLLSKMLEMIDNIKGRLDVLHLQGEE